MNLFEQQVESAYAQGSQVHEGDNSDEFTIVDSPKKETAWRFRVKFRDKRAADTVQDALQRMVGVGEVTWGKTSDELSIAMLADTELRATASLKQYMNAIIFPFTGGESLQEALPADMSFETIDGSKFFTLTFGGELPGPKAIAALMTVLGRDLLVHDTNQISWVVDDDRSDDEWKSAAASVLRRIV